MTRVVTDGTWTRADPIDVSSQISGLGTREIRWGDVPHERRSGYAFEGRDTELKLDGTDFSLGTFTHHNFVIPLSADLRFAVYLTLIFNFDDDNLQYRLADLVFHHDETLNQAPAPNDVVELPNVVGHDLLFIDDVEYKMSISGFLWKKRKVLRFDSEENKSESAELVARMEPTGRRGA